MTNKGNLSQRTIDAMRPGGVLKDGHSLEVRCLPNGRRVWYWRYRLNGKANWYTIGEGSPVFARQERDWAQGQVAQGIAPKLARDLSVNDGQKTLADLTWEWHADKVAQPQGTPKAWTLDHAEHMKWKIETFIAKHPIAAMPIRSIEPRAFLTFINGVPGYARGSVRSILDKVYSRALFLNLAPTNLAYNVREHMQAPKSSKTHPRAKTIEDARAVLAAFEASPAMPITKLAHRLLALTGLRIGELAAIRWDWIEGLDSREPMIRLPKEAMKGGRREHTVALAPQAVSILRWARRFRRYNEDCVFFGARGRGDSVCARSIAIMLQRTAPISFVPHSWRGTFSTLMNERDRKDQADIDAMLHHTPKYVSDAEKHYNHAQYAKLYRPIACAWADTLLQDAADLGVVCGGEIMKIAA